ncbi:hypothetical protein AB835_07890 [Candidatus Endobugula sertula]|uniref:Membrane transport protein MMPL domain-containing protein n=1 Tax=Candidatus Endobugula sertula TaxID=62101 RepID=A0A1D2QPV2_9GAMM|nr:hypothetical protein AB835_07890 [Candidatus Endobugula sertula]
MHKLFLTITNHLIKTRFYLWSLVVLVCIIGLSTHLLNGYSFDSNIIALLPEDKRSIAKELAEIHLANVINRQLILLLETDNNSSSEKLNSAEVASHFVRSLVESQSFAAVHGVVETAPLQTWRAFYQDKRYQLLTFKNKQQLQENGNQLMNESLGRLYSPLASLISSQPIDDPLQLFWQWQNSVIPKTVFEVNNGWLTRSIADKHYRMITIELLESPYNIAYQQRVMSALQQAQELLPTHTRLLSSGLILHAAYGAKQAKQEMLIIGIGSAVSILLLLFLCFRSFTSVFLAFIPLVIGCIIALSLSMLLFDRVHLITLAFGASLVGVAIDYPLHYFCAIFSTTETKTGAKTERPHKFSTLRKILPSLSIGLISSVLAYAAQGMAPFPGLRQMAFFSAIGLIGAWMTVICWVPVLQSHTKKFHYKSVIKQLSLWQNCWPTIESRVVKYLFIVFSFILITIVTSINTNNDIRLLQTSPSTLLQQEANIQKLLGNTRLGQYFVLQADSPQDLLELEERFSTRLQTAIKNDWISDFMATSSFVPSFNQQYYNYRLINNEVYKKEKLLSQFFKQTGFTDLEAGAKQRYENTRLQVFSPTDWLDSPVSRPFSHLWIGENNHRYYSVITLNDKNEHASYKRKQYLSSLAETNNNIEFVDKASDISQILRHYNNQLIQWLLLAYGLVLVLLLTRYRQQTWRIIAAPILASLIAISILHISGSTITVFHILALLLVLGIGLDASIFLQDTQHNPYTWLAVLLSSITTLLAFGLLALSSTPVLHYFGETVLWGILAVVLLAPCFVNRSSKGSNA